MTEYKEEMGFLPVTEGNHLICTDSKRTQKKGMDNDDNYFNEVDPEGNIVAKYYTWHHMNIYPPQNENEGWIKYSPEGNEIASGSRKNKII